MIFPENRCPLFGIMLRNGQEEPSEDRVIRDRRSRIPLARHAGYKSRVTIRT